MKVLHVSDRFPGLHKGWGGAEMGCKRLIESLDGLAEQSLLTLVPDCEEPKLALKTHFASIPAQELAVGGYFRRFGLLRSSQAARASFRKAFDEEKPDIVHFHRAHAMTWSCFENALDRGAPSILSLYDCSIFCPRETLANENGFHGARMCGTACAKCFGKGKMDTLLHLPLWHLRGRRIRKLVRKAASVIALSESWRPMLESFGIDKDKIYVVPLPLERIPSVSGSQDPYTPGRMLFAGWLQWRKGLHVLVDALETVVKIRPDVKLTVVATSPDQTYEAMIRKRIKDLGIEGHVEFRGRASQEEMAILLKDSEIVAIPEQWENPSPVFLCEAMSYAKKIVSSDTGGIPHLLGHGSRGFLAKADDPASWAAEILKALAPESSAKGVAAREFIARYCDKASIGALLMDIYKRGVRHER